jgi:protein SCO1
MNWSNKTLFLLILLCSCGDPKENQTERLPYYGPHEIAQRNNGVDTLHYTVPKFSFVNQDSVVVDHHTFKGKPLVVEFFFSRCESICPAITSQLVRLQTLMNKEGFTQEYNILSHTVDPNNDGPSVMKQYAEGIGVDHVNWHFVTGKANDIYYQASEGYKVPAFPSDTAQGGFFHTDQLALIDGDYHIRGYYDGTSTREVDSLMRDLKQLIQESKRK